MAAGVARLEAVATAMPMGAAARGREEVTAQVEEERAAAVVAGV